MRRATSDGRIVDVRPLPDKEVRKRGLHHEKEQQGYCPKDTVYEDIRTAATDIDEGFTQVPLDFMYDRGMYRPALSLQT